MLKRISSFHDIELTNGVKPLILCDIDETLLHFPGSKEFCDNLIKDVCPRGPEDPNYLTALHNFKKIYIALREPSHTDYDGFVSLLQLMFLTARRKATEAWTKKHFKSIGVNFEDFEIHYTDAVISKGEYIKRHINLDEWEHVIFIDDYELYIQSVAELHPQIVCYQFEAK